MPTRNLKPFTDAVGEALAVAAKFAPGNAQIAGAVVIGKLLEGAVRGALKNVFGPQDGMSPYALAFDDNPLTTTNTVGAQNTTQLRIPAAYDFIWKRWACVSSADGTAVLDFLVQIRFGNTDRNWTNALAGVHAASLVNVRRDPYELPQPLLIPRLTQVNLTTQMTAAQTRTVYSYLLGVIRYDYNLQDLTADVAA